MLFNDFLLLTRIKRPLITKIFQIINQTMFNHRREISKLSIKQSNIDWFDSFEGDHVYLTIYKKVNLFSLTRKKNQRGGERIQRSQASNGLRWIQLDPGIQWNPPGSVFSPWKK